MIDMSALLNQQGQLFLLLAVGLLFKRWGVVDDGFQKGLTDFLIKLILPCNIIYSFQMEFNQEILRQTSAILAVSTVIQLVCWLLAMTLYRRQAPEKRSALQYATLCSNGACLGAPLVEGIFGSQGMLLSSVYLVPQRVAMWTVGLSFFNQKNGQRQWKKILLNPCIDAVVIGMVLLVTQWRLPAVLGGTIKTFSSCNMGAAMFLIGMICAAIFAGFSFLTRYQMALSMGRTRKPQIAAEVLFSLIRSVILVLEVWLLSLLDEPLRALLYPAQPVDLSPAVFLQAPVIAACLLVPTVCSLLIAGILGRFGKKAGAVLYFAFLAVCFFGPRLIGHIQPDSLAARLFSAVFGMPPLALIAVCVLLLALLVWAAVRMLLTMRVTFP